MKTIKAVIGANYGDEGKGLMVDYLASISDRPLVIKSSGGSQAGHTVITPDGKRHVFSHLGSGTFAGAPTYLSRFFICNPFVFRKELEELLPLIDEMPNIYADQRCQVTTPFDMVLNQVLETNRGGMRHGSVGLGIGATISRSDVLSLTLKDVFYLPTLELVQRLEKIKLYAIDRLPDDLNDEAKEKAEILNSPYIIKNFIEDVAFARDYITFMDLSALPEHETLIFENGQGLLLDEEYGIMPHCTRSSCGLKNIVSICQEAGIDKLPAEIIYVSRWYLTRHGAGPLVGEQPMPSFVVDQTNITNEFQGSLRYAPLVITTMMDVIYKDFSRHARSPSQLSEARLSVAITCVDQIPPFEFEEIQEYVTKCVEYVSVGPTRKDVSSLR